MFWYLLSPIFAEANWDTELLSIAVAIGMLPSAFNDTPAYLGSLTPIVHVFILFFFVEADVGCHQGVGGGARANGGARLNDIMSLGFTNMTLKFLDTQPLHFDDTFMVRGVYSLQ